MNKCHPSNGCVHIMMSQLGDKGGKIMASHPCFLIISWRNTCDIFLRGTGVLNYWWHFLIFQMVRMQAFWSLYVPSIQMTEIWVSLCHVAKCTFPFWDVMVGTDLGGGLQSDLFRKPTAGNTIVQYNSSPPVPLLRSICFSQYLRLRHNCSDDATFRKQANLLHKLLLKCGCTKTTLKKAYIKAKRKSRSS